MLDLIENVNIIEKSTSQTSTIDPESIMVDIEGMHSNIVTGNYTYYTPEALSGSIPSWTNPYNKPCIMHHNEKDGKIIGRIINVGIKEKDTRSNTPALLFTVNIPDEDGKKQIRDGRLATVSVGISASDIRCSICGENVSEHLCEHERGKQYNGETCYWEIRSFKGKELSYVITPSDPYAHNVRIYSPSDKKDLKEQEDMIITENLDTTIPNAEDNVLNTDIANSNKSIENNGITNTDVSESENSNETPAEGTTTEQTVTESDESVNTTATEPVAENTSTETTESTENTVQEEAGQKNNLILSELCKMFAQCQKELAQTKADCEYYKTEYRSICSLHDALSIKYKTLLSSEINKLRTSDNRAVLEAEELSNRTIESLEDMLKDTRNDISIKENKEVTEDNNTDITENLQTVESPVNIISDTDTKENTVKNTEIDVREMFDNLGNKLFNI